MDWFDDKRIRQYAYSLLTMALTMFVLMGLFYFWNTQKLQRENFEEVSFHLTEFLDDAVHQEINEYISYAMNLSESGDVEAYLAEPSDFSLKFRVETLIDYSRAEYRNYVSIAVNSYEFPEERVHRCFIDDFDNVVEIEKSFFRSNPYYIGPFRRYQNKLLLQVTLPVVIGEEIKGSICLQIDMQDYIDDLVELITYQETGYIYIISEDHEIILTPRRVIDYESLMADFEIIKTQEEASPEIDDKVFYIKPLVLSVDQVIKYYIVFTQNKSELYGFSNLLIMNTIIIVLVFSSIFILLTKLTGRKFIRLAKEDTLSAVEETLDSEVKKQTQALRKIAEMDSLTKLYNHGSFYSLLSKSIEEAKKTKDPVCLLMLDLDYFKEVNDNYGHPIGDEVLVSIAGLLRDNIREHDIAGRYGGEEFAVMLKHIRLDKGYSIAERIRKQVLAMEFTDHKLKLTISIGIAELDQEDVAAFVKKADKKLYASKAYGRNKTTF